MKNQLYDPHVLHINQYGFYAGSWGSKFSAVNYVCLTVNKGITNASLDRVNALINSGKLTVKVDGSGLTSITRKYPWEEDETLENYENL